MAWSLEEREIFSVVYGFFLGLSESRDVMQLKKNLSIFMQNQKFPQSLIESSIHASNITKIHLQKMNMINGTVNALKV